MLESRIAYPIQNLKLKKAPGYDLITPKVLKELADVAFRYLTYIFNAILRTSTLPRQWKVAEIHMYLKAGKPAELPKSYRLISLLSILSKIMETLLLLCPIITCRKLISYRISLAFASTTLQLNSLIGCIQ